MKESWDDEKYVEVSLVSVHVKQIECNKSVLMCDKQTKIVNDQSRCSLLLLLYAVAFDLFFRVLSHRFDGLVRTWV